MTDFSMCQHETCPARVFCQRHPRSGTVPGKNYQHYETYVPELVGGKLFGCQSFMQVPLGKYPAKGRR